jgi:hypothetical protein
MIYADTKPDALTRKPQPFLVSLCCGIRLQLATTHSWGKGVQTKVWELVLWTAF